MAHLIALNSETSDSWEIWADSMSVCCLSILSNGITQKRPACRIFVPRQVAGRNDHFRPKDFGAVLCSLDYRYPGQRGCNRSKVNLILDVNLVNLAQIFTHLPIPHGPFLQRCSNPGFPYHGLQLCLASKHQLCGVVPDQCHFSAFCGMEPQLFRLNH